MKIFGNRRGIFRITAAVVESDPLLIKCLMGNCVIVRAEYMAMYDAIEYHAYSFEFDEVEDAVMTPEYDVIVDYKIGFRFERVELVR